MRSHPLKGFGHVPKLLSDRGLLVLSLLIFSVPTALLAELWVSNQQPLWTYSTYGAATSVAMSSDGSYIAVGVQTGRGDRSGQVILFNRAGTLLWAHNTSAIASVAITPDGTRIVAAGLHVDVIQTSPYAIINYTGFVYFFDRGGTELWEYSTVSAPTTPGQLIPPLFSALVSSDGSRVVVDNGLGTLVLNSLGTLLWSYSVGPPPYNGGPPKLTLSTGNASFIVSVDDKVHAFNSSGTSLWNSTSIQGDVVAGSMGLDGRFLAIEARTYSSFPEPTQTLMVYDQQGRQLWSRIISYAPSVVISPDESMILLASGGRVGAIDLQNQLLWNSTNGPANGLATTLHGSTTIATVPFGLGDNTIRVLDSRGKFVWGYGDFGQLFQVALSSDDSYLALAAGPYTEYSSSSAQVVLLPGPGILASSRGPTYTLLYPDPGQNSPLLFLVPVSFGAIPVAYVLVRRLKKARTITKTLSSTESVAL